MATLSPMLGRLGHAGGFGAVDSADMLHAPTVCDYEAQLRPRMPPCDPAQLRPRLPPSVEAEAAAEAAARAARLATEAMQRATAAAAAAGDAVHNLPPVGISYKMPTGAPISCPRSSPPPVHPPPAHPPLPHEASLPRQQGGGSPRASPSDIEVADLLRGECVSGEGAAAVVSPPPNPPAQLCSESGRLTEDSRAKKPVPASPNLQLPERAAERNAATAARRRGAAARRAAPGHRDGSTLPTMLEIYAGLDDKARELDEWRAQAARRAVDAPSLRRDIARLRRLLQLSAEGTGKAPDSGPHGAIVSPPAPSEMPQAPVCRQLFADDDADSDDSPAQPQCPLSPVWTDLDPPQQVGSPPVAAFAPPEPEPEPEPEPADSVEEKLAERMAEIAAKEDQLRRALAAVTTHRKEVEALRAAAEERLDAVVEAEQDMRRREGELAMRQDVLTVREDEWNMRFKARQSEEGRCAARRRDLEASEKELNRRARTLDERERLVAARERRAAEAEISARNSGARWRDEWGADPPFVGRSTGSRLSSSSVCDEGASVKAAVRSAHSSSAAVSTRHSSVSIGPPTRLSVSSASSPGFPSPGHPLPPPPPPPPPPHRRVCVSALEP